jgi:pimeloyl-ACP methyl ester carboxylesterase
MRRSSAVGLSILLSVALAVAVGLGGPRVVVNEPPHGLPTLPADIGASIAAREAGIEDLRPGAEKRIIWSEVPGASTPLAVIYLHGYSASRQETHPLSERVAEALQANLFLARLAGHGRDGPALAEVEARDWLGDALEAYAIGERLGERLIVIATSTGATLATWLALRPESERLAALVLISPNFGPRDARAELLLWPWAHRLAPLIAGETYHFEPANERQARHWTTEYPTVSLLPMMALVAHVRSAPLETIGVPVLAFYAPGDEIVDVGRMRAALERIGRAKGNAVEMVAVENAGDRQQHVLAGDILSPGTTRSVADAIVEFVQRRGVAPSADRVAHDQKDDSDHRQYE